MDTDHSTSTESDYPLSPADPQDLPAATFWPIGLAFGVTLLFWGFLTSLIVSGVGILVTALALAGWIGAFRE